MAADRLPCPCSCGCSSTRDASAALCWACTEGTHRAPAPVREHLEQGFEVWQRLLAAHTPDSSSGINARQLKRVADAWRDWHAKTSCPLKAAAA